MIQFYLLVAALLPVALVAQEFVPVFAWAYGARLLVVHTVVFGAAVALPFPAMLAMAFVAGFLWDARYHIPVYPDEATIGLLPSSELPFGFTIFLLGLGGSLIQGVRPLFRKGRWELPILMIGASTGLVLMLEYLAICFHRGGLETPAELWWKLLLTSLFSALLSPFLLLFLSRAADRTQYRIRMQGLKRRHA